MITNIACIIASDSVLSVYILYLVHFVSALHSFVCMERLNDPDVCTLHVPGLVHMSDNGPLTQKYSKYDRRDVPSQG